jgi:hypothetical protein
MKQNFIIFKRRIKRKKAEFHLIKKQNLGTPGNKCDEGKNKYGPNKCAKDSDCAEPRICSSSLYCMNKKRRRY